MTTTSANVRTPDYRSAYRAFVHADVNLDAAATAIRIDGPTDENVRNLQDAHRRLVCAIDTMRSAIAPAT